MAEDSRDPRKNPGIKREYYPLPVENPDGWRCIEVHIPDAPEYHELLITALKSLTLWYNYARDVTHRGKVIADRFKYALNIPELGCDMNCEELTECLAPLFDSVDTIKADVQALRQAIEQSLQANTATGPVAINTEECLNAYNGALALVQRMHKNNVKYYDEAENSFVDNASEALSIVLELFPKFQGLPYDEAFELGNAHFTNQVTAYNAGYATFEVPAACDLMHRIINTQGTLSIQVWGEWLLNLPTLLPDNAAANVFTRYAPARETFLNQIAALLNKESSLQSYFEDLWQVYYAGAQDSTGVLPEGCDCLDIPNITLENTYPGIDNAPVFIENTLAGGSIWECSYVFVEGEGWAVSQTPKLNGVAVACTLIEALTPVSYQHYDGATYISGTGDGASPPVWQRLGFYGSGAGTIEIEVQPLP